MPKVSHFKIYILKYVCEIFTSKYKYVKPVNATCCRNLLQKFVREKCEDLQCSAKFNSHGHCKGDTVWKSIKGSTKKFTSVIEYRKCNWFCALLLQTLYKIGYSAV